MPVAGEKRKEFARKVGVAIFEVVAINPGGAEIKALFEQDEEKEPEYITEKDVELPSHIDQSTGEVVKAIKTVKSCRIDVYLRDTKTQGIVKHAIFLQDRIFTKKDLSKTQYINDLGKTAWIDDVSNLPQKFTHYPAKVGEALEQVPFHEAWVGESDLIEFLDTWLSIEKKGPYSLSVDVSAFFRGNFRELQSLINCDKASLIMGTYSVRGVDGENGTQFYQSVWKKFLPAFVIKFFNTAAFTPERLRAIGEKDQAIKNKMQAKQQIGNNDWLSNYEKYALEITGEYGCKDSFDLEPAHDFDPETHYAMKAATIDSAGAEY